MNNTINPLRAANLALQLYKHRASDRVHAFNTALHYLEQASQTDHTCEHLCVAMEIADIIAVVEAGVQDNRIDALAIIADIAQLIQDLGGKCDK